MKDGNKYGNIRDSKYKSQAEKRVYEILSGEFDNVEYESETYNIIDGFVPKTLFFNRHGKKYAIDAKPCQGVTYTPDFTFTYKKLKIIIEVKGMENDVFPLKRKLFRKWLSEQNNPFILYFEIRTLKELRKSIFFIKESYDYIVKELELFLSDKNNNHIKNLKLKFNEIT